MHKVNRQSLGRMTALNHNSPTLCDMTLSSQAISVPSPNVIAMDFTFVTHPFANFFFDKMPSVKGVFTVSVFILLLIIFVC